MDKNKKLNFIKITLIFTFTLLPLLPKEQYAVYAQSTNTSSIDNSAVTTIYSQDNQVIGQIYPPFEVEKYYTTYNSDYLKKLTFEQYLFQVPPSASDYTAYQIDVGVKNAFLSYLFSSGNITKDNLNSALQAETTTIDQNESLPYFTDYVIAELHAHYESQLIQGGLTVNTTVDPNTYNDAQDIVASDVSQYVIPNGGDSAAMVVSNPSNGYILAMIGGPSWSASQINMAYTPRQQGSSMKPLIYIKSFEMGYSPQTIINDSPESFGSYTPNNYLGKYYGKVTIDQAINQSLNVSAVKMLYTIGYQNGIDELKKEGIQLDPKIYYGLPIILGAAEIPLTQMVGAYNALANGGFYDQATPFVKISRGSTVILDNTKVTQNRIIDANAVAMMDATLGDTSMKQPMYGSATQYYSVQGRPYGSKDGTTNGPKDVTVYEFIPQLTVGVWAGNTNNSNMSPNATGAFVVGPIAHSFIMQYIQQNNLPIVNFQTPNYPTLDDAHKEID